MLPFFSSLKGSLFIPFFTYPLKSFTCVQQAHFPWVQSPKGLQVIMKLLLAIELFLATRHLVQSGDSEGRIYRFHWFVLWVLRHVRKMWSSEIGETCRSTPTGPSPSLVPTSASLCPISTSHPLLIHPRLRSSVSLPVSSPLYDRNSRIPSARARPLFRTDLELCMTRLWFYRSR
jgi:hypothetical protein